MNFYTLIIGTEILNARRSDKHFAFVQKELAKCSREMFASFIVKDDVELIKRTFHLIKSDPKAVMFSFGGIGSTPDDLTREIAADVFTSKPLVRHKKFEQDILEKFGDAAYPHRIHMSDLPEGAHLLHNPINNMSGFSLQQKFFFVPGFPEMSHPMISQVIQTHFCNAQKKYRYTLLAQTSENTLITLMQKLPSEVELSSLPIFQNNKPSVELSLSGYNKEKLKHYFELFCKELQEAKIAYRLI